MKKITLLATVILLGINTDAKAIINVAGTLDNNVRYDNAEPIVFTERGIEFYVFADGQFDFNTEPSQGGMYYKSARRTTNKTYGAPATIMAGGVKIEHDRQGRIRRIGNVFMNYDANDRIKRIGSVYMSYNRFALAQVGNLKIVYDRFGRIVDYIGNVKGYSYGSAYAYDYGSYNGNSYNESDYYYYRADGTKAKVEEKTSEKK